MPTPLTFDMIFYFSWVLVNSLCYYAEFDFLIRFTETHKRRHTLLYIAVNSVLTIIAISMQMTSIFSFFQIVLLILFSTILLKIKFRYIVAPVVIIFTLSTFMEGFAAVFMRYISLTLKSPILGLAFQLILAAILAGFFFLELRFITKRYRPTNQAAISSYLYILLLPCTLIVWAIRVSLGLDSGVGLLSNTALVNGNVLSVLTALLWLTGALIVFFVIIEVFHKITTLSQQEIEKALLANQIKEQHNYIDEARQRNEGYQAFHHDINNHLLVLSGLLHRQEYKQAETYLKKLNFTSGNLASDISSGNSVLDVLLWEKIRYANKNGITVTCDVQIPKDSPIDDIDLCILFSNGLDNAILACMNLTLEKKSISLIAKPKHSFLLINIVNDTDFTDTPISYGTGLQNIKLTAEKYGGAVHTEKADNKFYLSILLCFDSICKNDEL